MEQGSFQSVSLGDLISLFYEEYFALYRNEELASVAAAATINELLNTQRKEAAGDKDNAAC